MTQKRYWLRGGLIIVLGILLLGPMLSYLDMMYMFTFGSIPMLISEITGHGLMSSYFLAIIFYFLIGSFIGWICGKIKKRKNLSQ